MCSTSALFRRGGSVAGAGLVTRDAGAVGALEEQEAGDAEQRHEGAQQEDLVEALGRQRRAAPGDEAAALELTYNWEPEHYTGGRNFGHLAYAVDNIYDTCHAFIAHGVTINRPPRDGRMAFVRTPDGISIELLQAGGALPPAEPWTSMTNVGSC